MTAVSKKDHTGVIVSHSFLISFLSDSTTSFGPSNQPGLVDISEKTQTLMMMTSVDWKSMGFASGSRTDAEDWKDWNKPVMSRESAKLLRKRTWEKCKYSAIGGDGG